MLLPVNILFARSPHYDRWSNPKPRTMYNLFRETLSAVLQGIGWTIGMAICGFAFVAFHLLIWAALILILPVTIFLLWRNPHFVSQRWKQIRRRIWDAVREKYGYTDTSMTAIEVPGRKRRSAEAFGPEPEK
jgi:hypothetical protein